MAIRMTRRPLVRPGAIGAPGPGGDPQWTYGDKLEAQLDEIILDLESAPVSTFANIALANAAPQYTFPVPAGTTYEARLNDGTELLALPGAANFAAVVAGANDPADYSYASIGAATADVATWTFPVPAGRIYEAYLADGTRVHALPGTSTFVAVPIDDPAYGQIPTYASAITADADAAKWTFPVPGGFTYYALLNDGRELRATAGTSNFVTLPATSTDPYVEVADAVALAALTGMVEGDIVRQTDDGSLHIWDSAAWRQIAGAAGAPMTGATAVAPGSAGTVPAPVAAAQDLLFHGNGQYRQAIPNWTGGTIFSTGALVHQSDIIYRRNVTDVGVASEITFNATEEARWTSLADQTEIGDKTYATVILADADTYWTFPVPALTTYVAWLDDGTQIAAGPTATGFTTVGVDWVFSTNGMNAFDGDKIVAQVGHTINLPAPTAGAEILLAPANGDWATLVGTFATTPPTDVALGQGQVIAGADVLRLIADPGNNNWIAAIGGSAAPGIDQTYATVAALPAASSVPVGRRANVVNDTPSTLNGVYVAVGVVGAASAGGWEK